MILVSRKSSLIAISVADFIISLAGSSWWWQTPGSTVTWKQSLLSMIWFSLLHCIDITEACESIKYFRLSRKGLNSLDEMKNKLREHLKGFERTSSPRIGELCNHSNTFSVQTSQIFVQSMVNYPTICNSFSSWEGSPPGWYVSSNCRELKRFYSAHDKGSTKR